MAAASPSETLKGTAMRREEAGRGRRVLEWTFVYFGLVVLAVLILAFLMVKGDEVVENPAPTPASTVTIFATDLGQFDGR